MILYKTLDKDRAKTVCAVETQTRCGAAIYGHTERSLEFRAMYSFVLTRGSNTFSVTELNP